MKKLLLLVLPALLLVSCESPAPVIISNPAPQPSYPSSSSSYTPSSTAPAPAPAAAPTTRTTYAYPNIAGVWKSDIQTTITIAPSSGGPFAITITPDAGRNHTKVHSETAQWGQPYHKHFRYVRDTGVEVIGTVTSLTPSTISIRADNKKGGTQIWRKVSDL